LWEKLYINETTIQISMSGSGRDLKMAQRWNIPCSGLVLTGQPTKSKVE
jgi:hypothetical protein